MTASFLSGLRWTLSQMVMQRSEMGLANPIDMMYHIQPWMIVTLLPFAFGFEGINYLFKCLFRLKIMLQLVISYRLESRDDQRCLSLRRCYSPAWNDWRSPCRRCHSVFHGINGIFVGFVYVKLDAFRFRYHKGIKTETSINLSTSKLK